MEQDGDQLAVLRRPDAGLLIGAGAEDQVSVGAERCIVHVRSVFPLPEEFAGRHLPDLDRVIDAGRNNLVAVGTKGGRHHRLLVRGELDQILGGFHVPDSHLPFAAIVQLADHGQSAAVGAQDG